MIMIKKSIEEIIIPCLKTVNEHLYNFYTIYKNIPMLSYTHGQVASPTFLGKEFLVFYERLKNQILIVDTINYRTKFGGCNGNMNAHYVTYPDINWNTSLDKFINTLGLNRNKFTTQIDHYDNYSEIFDCFRRINTILIDLNRDIWQYISLNYFKQSVNCDEVGSSTMPHKINPINFENSEGNLLLSSNLFDFMSNKLPISRLQRDLTDSTTVRNIGSAFSYMLIGLKSLITGLKKIDINNEKIYSDLNNNWVVVCEGIQNILKKNNIHNAYEKLKKFSRNNNNIDKDHIKKFIESLDINDEVKQELYGITPFNYTGNPY